MASDEDLRARYARSGPERARAFSPEDTAWRILSLIEHGGVAAEIRSEQSAGGAPAGVSAFVK
jgi:hypothetical protein